MFVKDILVFQNPFVVFYNPVIGQKLSSHPDSLGKMKSVRDFINCSTGFGCSDARKDILIESMIRTCLMSFELEIF